MSKESMNPRDDIVDNTPQERGADGALAGVEQDGLEEVVFPFDPAQISISSQIVPLSYLIDQIKEEAISAPQIQRGANLWTIVQQSRLIESLMLRIPLPLFYISVNMQDHWHIIDGLQRISAIRNYIIDENYQLCGLEFLGKECEGLYYKDLPLKYKKRIKETQLQFAMINATTPQGVQRTIFKRLNTGGLPLSSQEIRHALYYGESAKFLEKLSLMPVFAQATTGSVNDSRMAARELILRFIAFLVRGVGAYPRNGDMDGFLSETMQLLNAMPDLSQENLNRIFYAMPEHTECRYSDLDTIEKKFILAMRRACLLFDKHAFRKSTPFQEYRTPINKSLFDTISVILAELSESEFNVLLENKNAVWESLNILLNVNREFELLISRDSLKVQSVSKRVETLYNFFIQYAVSKYDK